MKRKPQARHKTEDIQKAVARIQNGESLSVVAKDVGVSKSLASYWVEHADRLVPADSVSSSPKSILRTRRFIEQCAVTIALAFERLKIELKKDSPKGVKDLGLLIAVLHDKQTQAAQRLEVPSSDDDQEWSASEDTLLILRQHKSSKVSTPSEKNIVEASVDVSALEQQKTAPPSDAPVAASPQKAGETSALPRPGGN
ncbi:MAG: hypothetical protein A2X28_06450 [Elusimicrobia bacterium GWA2_56_46]|nr:MAG: hypothetical protein A2X28_06450 [Elusimicrobia bacterium GWA2_56_46]OGR54906.1 MAG: hypothetical protein A2X39_11540 [Elusimicrobia bacterium GWC2_56_31]HBW23298.1 hypothetical protein [Elusimicrobiota bacterium]